MRVRAGVSLFVGGGGVVQYRFPSFLRSCSLLSQHLPTCTIILSLSSPPLFYFFFVILSICTFPFFFLSFLPDLPLVVTRKRRTLSSSNISLFPSLFPSFLALPCLYNNRVELTTTPRRRQQLSHPTSLNRPPSLLSSHQLSRDGLYIRIPLRSPISAVEYTGRSILLLYLFRIAQGESAERARTRTDQGKGTGARPRGYALGPLRILLGRPAIFRQWNKRWRIQRQRISRNGFNARTPRPSISICRLDLGQADTRGRPSDH